MRYQDDPPITEASSPMRQDGALSENSLASIPITCFGMISRTAARAATRVLAAYLAPLDLQPTQFPILVMIRLHGSESIVTLAEQLELEASALTRNVQRLERKGLIIAQGGRGRGGKRLALSAAGEAILTEAVAKWREAQAALLAEFGEEEAQNLRLSLKRLEEAAHRAEHQAKA